MVTTPWSSGQVGDAITLDPHANNGIVEASMASNIFDPLVILDKNMDVQPGLAESWENPGSEHLDLSPPRGRQVS